MTRVFLGVGGNVGDRRRHLRRAAAAVAALPGTRVVAASAVYETSPVGPRQKDFLNAALEIRTDLAPAALLAALKEIERSLGRRRRVRWGPREIDLDILYWGHRRLRAGGLEIPHPRRLERKFVLRPLLDLSPRFRDPVTGRTLAFHARRLTAPDQRIRLFSQSI